MVCSACQRKLSKKRLYDYPENWQSFKFCKRCGDSRIDLNRRKIKSIAKAI